MQLLAQERGEDVLHALPKWLQVPGGPAQLLLTPILEQQLPPSFLLTHSWEKSKTLAARSEGNTTARPGPAGPHQCCSAPTSLHVQRCPAVHPVREASAEFGGDALKIIPPQHFAARTRAVVQGCLIPTGICHAMGVPACPLLLPVEVSSGQNLLLSNLDHQNHTAGCPMGHAIA